MLSGSLYVARSVTQSARRFRKERHFPRAGWGKNLLLLDFDMEKRQSFLSLSIEMRKQKRILQAETMQASNKSLPPTSTLNPVRKDLKEERERQIAEAF